VDKKAETYANIPSSMEVIERKRYSPIKAKETPDVVISDKDTCLICGVSVESEACPRCGFKYCSEHCGDEWHKCLLGKHKDTPNKELRMIAREVRRVASFEMTWTKE
jgi:hypothetical protein